MTEALDDPDVLAELEILATDAATQKIYEYFSVTGPGQHTADTAVAYAQGVLDSSLQSAVFQSGWHAWQSSLHKDLATIARGGTPPVTTVDGSQISVDITPLVRSLLTGPVGFLARSALGDEPMIKSIDAGEDVESQLAWLGRIAGVRWWAVLSLCGDPRDRRTAGSRKAPAGSGGRAAGCGRGLPGRAPGPLDLPRAPHCRRDCDRPGG